MPRGLTAGVIAALQRQKVRPAIFVEAHFVTGPIYVWTGTGSISWNGHSWQGIGRLGSISAIEEGATVEARGISLTVSGFDSSLLALVMEEFRVGLPVKVWLGLFNDAGALIPDPIQSFVGRMDQPVLNAGADTASIEIACENRLVDLNTSVERRYTQDDQQLDYPGDRGFEFVNSIQALSIYWGRQPSSLNNR